MYIMKSIIKGNFVNLLTDEIYPAEIEVENGIIKCFRKIEENFSGYILPGFIDSHIHIESSMLTPSRFAEAVVPHGTTAILRPHEIANIMGIAGIEYMRKIQPKHHFKFFSLLLPACLQLILKHREQF